MFFFFVITFICYFKISFQQEEQNVNGKYHLTGIPRTIKDDLGKEFELARYFPENVNQRFGEIEYGFSYSMNMSVPLSYRGLDLAYLQKCNTQGRGMKELAQGLEKIDLNRDDMIDLRELEIAKDKLTWFESIASFIVHETSSDTIHKCSINYGEADNSWLQKHTHISMVGLLEAQKHCRDSYLPLPRSSRSALLAACDRNNDGKLSVTDDYVNTSNPCPNFPFHLISELPNTCFCRCQSIEMIFNKILDRY